MSDPNLRFTSRDVDASDFYHARWDGKRKPSIAGWRKPDTRLHPTVNTMNIELADLLMMVAMIIIVAVGFWLSEQNK